MMGLSKFLSKMFSGFRSQWIRGGKLLFSKLVPDSTVVEQKLHKGRAQAAELVLLDQFV